jgi:hypothetical protein
VEKNFFVSLFFHSSIIQKQKNMSYNYDVAGLDSLVFDTPAEATLQYEKEVADELDLWVNI